MRVAETDYILPIIISLRFRRRAGGERGKRSVDMP